MYIAKKHNFIILKLLKVQINPRQLPYLTEKVVQMSDHFEFFVYLYKFQKYAVFTNL